MRPSEIKTAEFSIPKMALVYAALIALALSTWGLSHVRLGIGNDLLAMAIAVTKTLLVVAVFMNLLHERRLPKLFAAAGVCWLFLMGTIVSDDFTRQWDDLPRSWVRTEVQSRPITPVPFQGFRNSSH